MSRSPTFCVLPWVHLATNSSGALRVCCNSTPGLNTLKKENGATFRLNEDDLDLAWKSPTLKQIRQQMIDGIEPQICQRCFTEERGGVKSARQKWNARWSSPEENSVTPDILPKYIDLRLGNLCNLKCRMCNPYASSKWVKEWNDVADTATLVPNFKLSKEESERLSHMTWMEDEKTWNNLFGVIEKVEEIYLTGGEPTLIKQQTQFLERLVEKKISSELVLKYNTNLTNLPDSLVHLWQQFKLVKLNVSIDGFGPLNEYIRYPSKWSTISGNLQKLSHLKKMHDSIHVGVHTTVQNYNILHLSPLFTYLIEEIGTFPYLNILNHPKCMNIRVLPSALKSLASERLNDFSKEISVMEVLNYMNSADHNEDFLEFQRFTNRCDSLRDQNFIDLCPEYKEYWPS